MLRGQSCHLLAVGNPIVGFREDDSAAPPFDSMMEGDFEMRT